MKPTLALSDLIACADRVVMRMNAYPKWVDSGRMSHAKASTELEAMMTIGAVLLAARAGEPLPVAPEFPKQGELIEKGILP